MGKLLASNSMGAIRAVEVYVAGAVQGIAAVAGCFHASTRWPSPAALVLARRQCARGR